MADTAGFVVESWFRENHKKLIFEKDKSVLSVFSSKKLAIKCVGYSGSLVNRLGERESTMPFALFPKTYLNAGPMVQLFGVMGLVTFGISYWRYPANQQTINSP